MNNIDVFLKEFINLHQCTLLGIGPMSKNCVDAALQLAGDQNFPLMLIASRRQIDSKSLGGGYVNNWDTSEFSNYVLSSDKKLNVILARDHGGPWQSMVEVDKNLPLSDAMSSAKSSFLNDIESGFQIIHIDPSVDIQSPPSLDAILERLFELYEYCWIEAGRLKREIIFEVGTEEQSGGVNSDDELKYILEKLTQFCSKNRIIKPSFIVVQTGTKVMEMKNIGSFDSDLNAEILESRIRDNVLKMVKMCNEYGIMMKEHNADYLSNAALRLHPRLGIHAANVAPEFGIIETRSLIYLLEKNSLGYLSEQFLSASFKSMKWKKWMLDNSTASDRDKSIMAGHYIYSTSEGAEIIAKAKHELLKKNVTLDLFLVDEIKKGMLRYLINFGILG